jgi:hypothetical protein
VRISTVRESLLLVFRKNRQLFLELRASIGINDIGVRKKMGEEGGFGDGGQGGDGDGGQGKVAKEQIAKEKRKALEVKSAGTQHRHPRGSFCKKQEGSAAVVVVGGGGGGGGVVGVVVVDVVASCKARRGLI